jgi:hypothetical protein
MEESRCVGFSGSLRNHSSKSSAGLFMESGMLTFFSSEETCALAITAKANRHIIKIKNLIIYGCIGLLPQR